MLKLRFKNNKANAIWLVEPKVTIGRAAGNNLVIADPALADVHVEIHAKDEALVLVNKLGDESVRVDNQPVSGKVKLRPGAEIAVGGNVLEVVDPKSEHPAKSATAKAPSTGWALKSNSAALANRVFPIKPVTTIGRSSECDISLSAAHLSRRHAQLILREGLLYVKDLGSSNGTYINNEKITEARVHRGDELRFDTLSFGVIGPANDMDKTTLRAAPQQMVAAAKQGAPKAAVARTAVKKNAVNPSRKAPLRQPTPAGVAQLEQAPEPRSKLGLISITLIAALAIAAAVAYQQGFLPLK